jgi:hypothetical protein
MTALEGTTRDRDCRNAKAKSAIEQPTSESMASFASGFILSAITAPAESKNQNTDLAGYYGRST